MSARRVVISGQVQGVWYRAWTVGEATKRGLRGWVRNLRDGKVEALFAGPIIEVEAMIDACRRGPPLARVTGIETHEADEPDRPGFHQLPDG
ncbi:MAG: acylphosphatase [Pseudomonadota bacterium]